MPKYKVLGIYSFADNLRKMNIGDQVILKTEKHNIKSKDAIGVYSLDNKKLGYLPVETTDEVNSFNLSYKISNLVLNQGFPIVEISRYYPMINSLNNIEYPFEKKIKYEYKLINISKELKQSIINLEKYLATKRIKVKSSAVIYFDDNYINLLVEVSKGIQKFETVTIKYFKENADRYEELYENEIIDHTFFRELLIYRLECYYESNYTHILEYNSNIPIYDIIEESIHNPLEIELIDKKKKMFIKAIGNEVNDNILDYILVCKLYMRYLLNDNDYYLIKYIGTDDIKKEIKKIFKNYKLLRDFIINNNLELGNFMYDHQLKIYDYIEFINNDTVFVISDNFNIKYIYSVYLANKKNLIVYNPLEGKILKINNIII
jgi:hypothetical protein